MDNFNNLTKSCMTLLKKFNIDILMACLTNRNRKLDTWFIHNSKSFIAAVITALYKYSIQFLPS